MGCGVEQVHVGVGELLLAAVLPDHPGEQPDPSGADQPLLAVGHHDMVFHARHGGDQVDVEQRVAQGDEREGDAEDEVGGGQPQRPGPGAVQTVNPASPLPLPRVDLSGLAPEAREAEARDGARPACRGTPRGPRAGPS